VEATRVDDADKNRLCAPMGHHGGELASFFVPALVPFFLAQMARMAEPDLNAWNEATRLNPACGAADQMHDPRAQAAFARLAEHMQPAVANVERLTQRGSGMIGALEHS
jgi:hypothetical protein